MHSGHSSCPSPTELPLLKLLDAQPALCSMDHRFLAAGVQAQRTGLRKRTAGLKAKKSHLHQECKGQAVVCRSSAGKKPHFFTLLKFTDFAKSITLESDSPLAQSRVPWCCHHARLTDHGASLRFQLRFASPSVPATFDSLTSEQAHFWPSNVFEASRTTRAEAASSGNELLQQRGVMDFLNRWVLSLQRELQEETEITVPPAS